MRKRSTRALLSERKSHWLKGFPKKGMWKVAFEPEYRESVGEDTAKVFPPGSR